MEFKDAFKTQGAKSREAEMNIILSRIDEEARAKYNEFLHRQEKAREAEEANMREAHPSKFIETYRNLFVKRLIARENSYTPPGMKESIASLDSRTFKDAELQVAALENAQRKQLEELRECRCFAHLKAADAKREFSERSNPHNENDGR